MHHRVLSNPFFSKRDSSLCGGCGTNLIRLSIVIWCFSCTSLYSQGFPNRSLPSAFGGPNQTNSPTATVESEEQEDGQTPYVRYVSPKTIEMLIGVKVTAKDGNLIGVNGTTVFPTPWPEQKVEIVEVNMPPAFRYGFRDLPGGNKQLLFQSRLVPARSTVEGTLRLRLERSHIAGPQDPTDLVIPRREPREVKMFTGNSPFIRVNNPKIRKIIREIDAEDPLTDWRRIEMMYDWVRDNIVYTRGELKTVDEALRDGTGDCEEMTSTFVALCRAAGVPARCVWIPNHCYPEFYLEDQEGNGYWFPCQVAGTRNFGSMPEYLPILQKGDRFKVPEQTEAQRYIRDYLKVQRKLGRQNPEIEFIRTMLGDAATLDTPEPDELDAEPTP